MKQTPRIYILVVLKFETHKELSKISSISSIVSISIIKRLHKVCRVDVTFLSYSYYYKFAGFKCIIE